MGDERHDRLPLPLYLAWFSSFLASLASLYFIEILGNPAAAFCWVERMLMLGLFLLLTTAIIKKDTSVRAYTIGFLVIGISTAFYQQLVHWGVIVLPVKECSVSVVCTTKFFELFGFITQATLCLSAFVIIGICMWLLQKKNEKKVVS